MFLFFSKSIPLICLLTTISNNNSNGADNDLFVWMSCYHLYMPRSFIKSNGPYFKSKEIILLSKNSEEKCLKTWINYIYVLKQLTIFYPFIVYVFPCKLVVSLIFSLYFVVQLKGQKVTYLYSASKPLSSWYPL